MLRTRDALLESTGLEAHKLSEMLDKERQARKQDRHHFEQVQRGHQSVSRTIQQHESRVAELENARGQDRRKLANLEQQYRNQLAERNNLLLAIWNRLSTLCGSDWSQRNSLVEGEVPSVDVVSRNIAGFSRNIISAVKTVENLMGSFRSRIRNVEKDLWKDFQTLEHNLDVRSRTLEQLERTVHGRMRAASHSSSYSAAETEITRLKSENKRLRTELQYRGITTSAGSPSRGSSIMAAAPSEYHYQHPHQQLQDFGPQGSSPSPSSSTRKRTSSSSGGGGGGGGGGTFANITASLLRHHSTSTVEALRQAAAGQRPLPQPQSIAPPLPASHVQSVSAMAVPTVSSTANQQQQQPSEQRWIHRLKELERRLKAEREARLLDRSGARKRLEERSAENQELKAMLARERDRDGRGGAGSVMSSAGGAASIISGANGRDDYGE